MEQQRLPCMTWIFQSETDIISGKPGLLRSADIFLPEKKEPGLFPILIMRMIPSGLRSFRHFFFDLFRRNQRLGIFRIPACFPVKEEHENK